MLNQKWFRISPYTINIENNNAQRGKWISEMQYRYIHKMETLCQSKGIKFRLLSGPVRESFRKQVNNIAHADAKAQEPIFKEYFRFSTVWHNHLRNKHLTEHLRNNSNELATVRFSAFCGAMLSNNSFLMQR